MRIFHCVSRDVEADLGAAAAVGYAESAVRPTVVRVVLNIDR